jgi:hypothetical protein
MFFLCILCFFFAKKNASVLLRFLVRVFFQKTRENANQKIQTKKKQKRKKKLKKKKRKKKGFLVFDLFFVHFSEKFFFGFLINKFFFFGFFNEKHTNFFLVRVC